MASSNALFLLETGGDEELLLSADCTNGAGGGGVLPIDEYHMDKIDCTFLHPFRSKD